MTIILHRTSIIKQAKPNPANGVKNRCNAFKLFRSPGIIMIEQLIKMDVRKVAIAVSGIKRRLKKGAERKGNIQVK